MSIDDQRQAVLEHLETLIRMGKSVSEAADNLHRMGIDRVLIESVVAFRDDLANRQRELTIVGGGAMFDPEAVSAPWYIGSTDNDIYWPSLRDSLLADPNWAHAVPSLDRASTDIVGLLADPHSLAIKTRGLVVGHVQSGKTANFTATIAKAADAGYRMFIVLSGVHNALRRQTQLRLERQLHDLEPKRWLPLTDEHRDFGNPVKALALVAGTDLRLLAVVKKNASRLKRLRDWLYSAQEHGGFDTCPVLIIDDEADQASPNAAQNGDLDRTKINDLIVDILRLPRVAYIGYTATPFANVLIDPESPEDLYPRNFIYALRKPDTYFGAEELFGLDRSEDEITVEHDMLRYVTELEADAHRIKPGQPFAPSLTHCLEESIRWFLLATAARRVRTGGRPHSSMLIHTTSRVAPQFAYQPLVRDVVKAVRGEVERGETAALRLQWETETEREAPREEGLNPVSFEELGEALLGVTEEAKVVVDNGQSTDRLLYDDNAGTTVIAIGGNTLSRGLTLEGLVSSYFLRGANAYDTLLQMGRWFGYRLGYSDLPRIWTTRDLAESFRFLADVERDIRSDIERYAVEQTTPSEVAVRIRLHPRMSITSRLRMQFAVQTSSSFSGQRPQTILFHHRERETIDSNQEAACALVSAAMGGGSREERTSNKVVLRDIPVSTVLAFIRSYRFHENSEASGALLAGYIEAQNRHSQLLEWNAAIMTREDVVRGTLSLGLSAPVNLIERSKLVVGSDRVTANIGTLMSKPDRVADLMDGSTAFGMKNHELVAARTDSGRGLLLLYPIAADSKPKNKMIREPLDADGHLIGVAVAFPVAPRETDPSSTVAVDLSRIRPVVVKPEDDLSEDEYADVEGDRDDVDLGG